jgi:hypothetical protein
MSGGARSTSGLSATNAATTSDAFRTFEAACDFAAVRAVVATARKRARTS